MIKWGKLFVFVMAIVLTVSACSTSTGSNGGQSSDSNASPKDEQEVKTYKIRIGYENNPGEPVDLAVNKWKQLAEEKSDGRLELELFPSSQLGTKVDLTEQMRAGDNVITLTDGSFLADFVPDIGITSGPYLANDVESMLNLYESDWFEGIKSELEDEEIYVVTTNWLYGIRHVIANKPALTPDDFKGMKLRVPNADIFVKTFEAMGATPTPMPLGDVYPSLAQGVIDGMENPLTVIEGSKAYEQAKHIILTGHMTMLTSWIAGQSFIESLPDDLVAILKETGDEAGDFMTATVLEVDEKTIEELEAEGVTFHEVDQDIFKKAVEPIYNEFPEWSPGLYETVQQAMKK